MLSSFLGALGAADNSGSTATIDLSNHIVIVGTTNSISRSLIDASDLQYTGRADVFVAVFSPTGSLVYSTSFGGSNDDYGNAIVVNAYQPEFEGGTNAFLTLISFCADFGGCSSHGKCTSAVTLDGISTELQRGQLYRLEQLFRPWHLCSTRLVQLRCWMEWSS